jgi:putative ABC transport system permease protein
VMVRVAPGAGADLKQRIAQTIAGGRRGWHTELRTLEEDRHDRNTITLAPLAALLIAGTFLIVNVALGLFGVLSYNIQQRRAEIGLRRALGATSGGIGQQFLGETLVLALFGVVVGAALAVQFPLLGAFNVETPVYLQALGAAALVIFALAALCALQPSRRAARIHPAVALREE